jgi:hypothetical protein
MSVSSYPLQLKPFWNWFFCSSILVNSLGCLEQTGRKTNWSKNKCVREQNIPECERQKNVGHNTIKYDLGKIYKHAQSDTNPSSIILSKHCV